MSTGIDLRLEVRGLARVIGRRALVRRVSFEVRSGESVALVGPNGSGKTTLLSVLAGRQPADHGSVVLRAGERALGPAAFRERVAMLPHDLFVYLDLTAAENLAFFAALHGSPGSRVGPVLEAVGLSGHAGAVGRTFSRGMLQRLAAGRLLISGAVVWLLDEPSTGLDAPGRRWLADCMAAHVRDGGILIFASHDRNEVTALAHRILVMKDGGIAADLPGGEEGADRAFSFPQARLP